MNHTSSTFKSGFIVIVGAPNAGKSTLLNRVLGEKISITSQRPQTTRNRILGVMHRPNAQLVFIDTPGIHPARQTLNVRIVDQAVSAMGDGDLVLFVVDAAQSDLDAEALLLKKLKATSKPAVLALNKIDLVDKPELLSRLDKWQNQHDFADMVPISATRGTQVDVLIQAMEKLLPDGPPFFEEDMLTDLPQRFLAAEIIREKVFRMTGQEIPYSTAVTVTDFSKKDRGRIVHIHATIHLERDSQKGIVIGKGGRKLGQIGEAARKSIEQMLETKVFLKLLVRIQKNWSRDTKALRKFGY
ncbi:MAG: GTPase Era [Deltaproteobacteria bacterium]|nr:GTPase Era [Deltaproteobacteria bacterium]